MKLHSPLSFLLDFQSSSTTIVVQEDNYKKFFLEFELDDSASKHERDACAKIAQLLDGRGKSIEEEEEIFTRSDNDFKYAFMNALSCYVDKDDRKRVQKRYFDAEFGRWIRHPNSE